MTARRRTARKRPKTKAAIAKEVIAKAAAEKEVASEPAPKPPRKARQRAAPKAKASPTANDAVNAMFSRLRDRKIHARMTSICCSSCGVTEMDKKLAANEDLAGYCFIDSRERRRLDAEGQAYVVAGARQRTDDESIMKIVVEAATESGIQTRWSGDAKDLVYISIPNFKRRERKAPQTKSPTKKTAFSHVKRAAGPVRMPRYPMYIPSKGRAEVMYTCRTFDEFGVPYKIVIEPQEAEKYAKAWGEDNILVLPENDQGLVYSRKWIMEHAIANGHERHWQFDDDIQGMIRMNRGWKLPADASIALCVLEDFCDRYENVGLASFNSEFFVSVARGKSRQEWPPFYLNGRCYTNFLINNQMPFRFRGRINEDTDMSLQVATSGEWCTILLNVFMMRTPETMMASGGQVAEGGGYDFNDGRLKMSRELERVWPGTVTTYRRFGRPQHKVAGFWRKFDTPLRLKPGVELPEGTDEYGMALKVVDGEPRDKRMVASLLDGIEEDG